MTGSRAERRLAAILAADVVDYSHLVEQDEAGTLATLKDLRRGVIDPLVAYYRGRIVKLMGDGAIVEFGSVVDAVVCANAIQKGVAQHEADRPAERRIVFRVGVNLGNVVVEEGDLLGDGVNVAARLEQHCPPGGVLISGTAYDHLQGKLDLPIAFAGEQRVKNIDRPIRTYRIGPPGSETASRSTSIRPKRLGASALLILLALGLFSAVAYWYWPNGTSLSDRASLAVLPFKNLSGDEATGRLVDGITEDIITDLARFREFDVIARNSTVDYKGKPADVRQVGKDLNVRYVLEGSVQRQGDQLRVTAQLVDATSAAHLWSERWDRPANDVFAVQSEVAEQVAARLGGWGVVVDAERRAARRKRPQDLSAYEMYLRGIDLANRGTKETTDEAVRFFTMAVERDPHLARAWAALAAAHDYTVSFGADLLTAEEKAKRAAERAVALDPADADARRVLAKVLGTLGDLRGAAAEFEEAMRLNPGDASILATYAASAAAFGQAERGAEAVDRAIRLNPRYGVGAANRFRHAYLMAGRYEDALRMVEGQPPDSRTVMGWVERSASYAALGRTEDARAAVADALARHPNLSIQGLLSRPDLSDEERRKFEDLMRKAGFPVCAKEPDRKSVSSSTRRLPECVSG